MSEYRKYVSILNETSENVTSMWKDLNGNKFSTVFLNPIISKVSNIDLDVDRLLSETNDAFEKIQRYKEG